ncbi:MAG TPA: RNB domain-containing ribonuclease, partial [Bacteroidales bacterium]|nr:RNB domain-containing ribonuclease [Bacteroidales bacterium]
MARKGKNRSRRKAWNKDKLVSHVLGIFSNNPRKNLNYKQVSKMLDIKEEVQRQLVVQVLAELKNAGQLEEPQTGKYTFKERAGYTVGKIDMTQYGYGFLVTEEAGGEDVFIPRNLLHTALDGDLVKVYVYPSRKRTNRNEGEVIQIIERARENFVGIVEISDQFAFLITDDKKMPYDLFIPLDKLNGAKEGDKAIARITDWPRKVKNPFAEIIEVLGRPGENEVEMHSILAEFNLPWRFPEDVSAAAENISEKITKEDYQDRRDFRSIPTFTIDPKDANDFDDALSMRYLENGNLEVGIHIADVTHYVETKTIIEEEAYDRATSVYLVDRVVPMLPERLSNFICSLRPDEEKLCFSAVFELNNNADVLSEWIGRTVIKSQRRFTYEEAQEIIEGSQGDMKDEILTLNKLAQTLRNRRFEHGAIAFDRVEVKFNLDEKGNPISVYFKEMKESNQLVEEFMLLANRRVSEFVNRGCKFVQDAPKTSSPGKEK